MQLWCGCGRVFEAPRFKKYCLDCVALIRISVRMQRSDLNLREGHYANEFGVNPKSRKRQRILKRDNWTCQICLLPIPHGATLGEHLYGNVDHVVPRAAGGMNDDVNYQATHAICNGMKAAQEDELFKDTMREMMQEIVHSLML
jgi:5-methylcytosine-specific restriction endonuclease McrA